MPRKSRTEEGSQEAFGAALDLERHMPRALATGLFLAAMLHAAVVAYAKLMPVVPGPPLYPIVVRPMDLEIFDLSMPPYSEPPYVAAPVAVSPPAPTPVTTTTSALAPARRPDPPPPAPTPSPTSTPTPTASEATPPPPPPPPEPVASAPPPPPPRPRGPDRSAPARLGGRVGWKCPWPREADPEMRHAIVRARATVRIDGSAEKVEILDEPGWGFGRAARLCAMSHTFVPARGPDGEPAEGDTLPFPIHFDKY